MTRYYRLAGIALAALMIATKWCEGGGSVAVYAVIAAGLAVMMLVLAYKIDAAIRRGYKVQRDERLWK